jgi:purine-binding chemotaxis protein CheW
MTSSDTKMANQSEAGHHDEETTQYLTFRVGDSEYGVDITSVHEVKGWAEPTRLPNKPHYIRGVLNLRGVIVPTFDIRARFNQGLTHTTEKHVIIILAVGERVAGVLVDGVSDILTVSKTAVKAPPDQENDGESRFVNGLIAIHDRMVVLLDMPRLLSEDTTREDHSAPREPVALPA